jgi:hypothetical protein
MRPYPSAKRRACDGKPFDAGKSGLKRIKIIYAP